MNAIRPWPRRRTSSSTLCAAALTTSPACCGVSVSGTGGVGTSSDSSWAIRRSTRGGSGGSWTRKSAGSLRASSSPATASLAAIIRNSISRCDSVCCDGSRLSTWPSCENANSGSEDSTASAPRASRASASACADLARGTQRRGPGLERALVAREDAVHARVVEPLVGADDRAVERRPPHVRALELELDGHGQPVLVRDQRARAVRQRLGQHRLDQSRDVDRVRAPERLAVERRPGLHERAHVGDVHPHADRRRPAAPRPRSRRRSPSPSAGRS